MKYIYTGHGYFYQGLPAMDLNDTDLDDEQLAKLVVATMQGYYGMAKSEEPYVQSDTQDTAPEPDETEEVDESAEA